MKLSRFKFFAYTNPGLEKTLETELKKVISDTPRTTNIFGRKGVEFRADVGEMTDVILKTRTVNSLNIQIGRPFHAANVKTLKRQLASVNWTSFFNSNRFLYRFPMPIVKSEASTVYHEGLIRDEFTKALSKSFSSVGTKAHGVELQHTLFPQLESHSSTIGEVEHGASSDANPDPIKFLSRFHLNMYKNKLNVSLNVFNADSTKTGYKKRIGWGSVKDSIASSFFISTGLKQQFLEEKSVKIFDPFCGSGTFLIEALLNVLEVPVRDDDIHELDFWKWEFIKTYEDDLKERCARLTGVSSLDNLNQIEVSLVGTDISKSQLSNAVANFEHVSGAKGLLQAFNPVEGCTLDALKEATDKHCIPSFTFDGKALLTNCDFSDFPTASTDGASECFFDDHVLVTNIPFGGEQSRVQDTNAVYAKLDQFLGRHHTRFRRIFIMNRANVDNSLNYCKRSVFGWKPVLHFSNGGMAMGFYEFSLSKDSQ